MYVYIHIYIYIYYLAEEHLDFVGQNVGAFLHNQVDVAKGDVPGRMEGKTKGITQRSGEGKKGRSHTLKEGTMERRKDWRKEGLEEGRKAAKEGRKEGKKEVRDVLDLGFRGEEGHERWSHFFGKGAHSVHVGHNVQITHHDLEGGGGEGQNEVKEEVAIYICIGIYIYIYIIYIYILDIYIY
jgi:hypothetical protein